MSESTQPVRGPMYIEATPSLVTADVTPLVENNVHDLLELLMEEDHFEDFMALAAADPTGEHDGHAPDPLAFDELKARLVARLATKVALTGPQALRVAGRMQELAEPMAPPAEAVPACAEESGHDLASCELCAPLRHPSGAQARKGLAENPLPTQQDRRVS
ncbi:hypothetical protein [Streptomyces sp. NPDC096153]|uniref:hypothetical protein n=1 Tax=Streptomyces sp. NPDC096153 TaxID=3155548 RepID=UPI0033205E05